MTQTPVARIVRSSDVPMSPDVPLERTQFGLGRHQGGNDRDDHSRAAFISCRAQHRVYQEAICGRQSDRISELVRNRIALHRSEESQNGEEKGDPLVSRVEPAGHSNNDQRCGEAQSEQQPELILREKKIQELNDARSKLCFDGDEGFIVDGDHPNSLEIPVRQCTDRPQPDEESSESRDES